MIIDKINASLVTYCHQPASLPNLGSDQKCKGVNTFQRTILIWYLHRTFILFLKQSKIFLRDMIRVYSAEISIRENIFVNSPSQASDKAL